MMSLCDVREARVIETQSTSMFSILNMNIIIVKRKQQSTTLKMEKERANTELKLMTNRVL